VFDPGKPLQPNVLLHSSPLASCKRKNCEYGPTRPTGSPVRMPEPGWSCIFAYDTPFSALAHFDILSAIVWYSHGFKG
jgi:hypothetical protein